MKKNVFQFGTAIILAAVVFTFMGCDNGTGGSSSPPKSDSSAAVNSSVYSWEDANFVYELKITESVARSAITSGTYVLLIISKQDYSIKISTGSAASVGDSIELQGATMPIIISGTTVTIPENMKITTDDNAVVSVPQGEHAVSVDNGSGNLTSIVIRWSFWGNETRIAAAKIVAGEFSNAKSIPLFMQPAAGANEHFDQFSNELKQGGGVDIVQLGGQFNNISSNDDPKDVLISLAPYVTDGTLNTASIDKAAIDAGTRNGVLYAIPVASNMPAMIYNKAALTTYNADIPNTSMTWTQFETWLSTIKDKLPSGVYPMTDYGSNTAFFGYWATDNETPVWDGSQTKLTAAEVKKYFDMWAELRTNNIIPAYDSGYNETSSLSHSAGTSIITFAWSNQVSSDTELIMPPNASTTKKLWGQMSQMMGINKNSKNPKAAAEFLNYFTNTPSVWATMGTTYGIPVTPAGRDALPSNPIEKKQSDYLDAAGNNASPPLPNVPKLNDWNTGFAEIYANFAQGTIDSTQASNEVMTLINDCK